MKKNIIISLLIFLILSVNCHADNSLDTSVNTRLGIMYMHGNIEQGIKQDYEKAYEIFLKFAKKGDAEAQYLLGVLFEKAKGVKIDNKRYSSYSSWKKFEGNKQSVYWYKKAAENGQIYAQYILGFLNFNGLSGVQKDFEKAFYWYKKAAEQGFADAQIDLGAMYLLGDGVVKEPKQGFHWFKMAAEQGSISAQYKLGELYYEGSGVKKDLNNAVFWYKKAGEKECYHLSVLYDYPYDYKSRSFLECVYQSYAQSRLEYIYANFKEDLKDQ